MAEHGVPTGVASLQWFALRVKSRCEKVVATIARNKGFEEFLPLYQCRRRWSDRTKLVELPLFPGYVFCRIDRQRRLPLLTIPGALHFVGLGPTPLPVDESEIASIRTAVHSGLSMEPAVFIERGQRIRLNGGPLTGMEGIYLRDSRQDRVIVSVTLLRRSIAVAIDHKWAVPCDGAMTREPGESDIHTKEGTCAE